LLALLLGGVSALSATVLIPADFPRVQFLVARAPHLDDALFPPLAPLEGARTVEGQADDVLSAADAAIVASPD